MKEIQWHFGHRTLTSAGSGGISLGVICHPTGQTSREAHKSRNVLSKALTCNLIRKVTVCVCMLKKTWCQWRKVDGFLLNVFHFVIRNVDLLFLYPNTVCQYNSFLSYIVFLTCRSCHVMQKIFEVNEEKINYYTEL